MGERGEVRDQVEGGGEGREGPCGGEREGREERRGIRWIGKGGRERDQVDREEGRGERPGG